MSVYEYFRELCEQRDEENIQELKKFEADILQNDKEFMECVQNDIERFNKTGVLTPSFGNNGQTKEPSTETSKKNGEPKQRTNSSNRASCTSDSSKENEPINNNDQSETLGRSRRNAFLEASQVINQQVSQPLNTKLRQTTTRNKEVPQEMVIKVEKMSVLGKPAEQSELTSIEIKIKQEAIDMPPPSKPPIKQSQRTQGRRTRNTNVENVQVKLEERVNKNSQKRLDASTATGAIKRVAGNDTRDSDVEIQAENIDTIILNDTVVEDDKPSRTRARTKTKRKLESKQQSSNSEESEGDNKKQRRNEEAAAVEQTTTRVTRTKTRAAKNKEVEQQSQTDSSTEDEKAKIDKSQTKKGKTKKATENSNASEYEDAVSDVDKSANASRKDEPVIQTKPIMNETMVINKPPAVLNETMVIEKPKNILNETTTISVPLNNNKHAVDALITDDEDIVTSSPVTKKLKKTKAVFSPYEEKPVRTRVKAFEKLCAEANTEVPSKIPCASTKTSKTKEGTLTRNGVSVENSKESANSYITPLRTKLTGNLSACMTANSTYLSEVKTSQTETRTRQLRLKQKETEALRKQEAVLQTLAEEKKRRREERQLKAQHARDAIIREKQRMLDSAVKAKEEKLKKMLSEREEKLQKQREQAAIKRAQAIKKAAEEKLKEDRRRDDREEDTRPRYLREKAPLLPTGDCYDSDDDQKAVKLKPIEQPWTKRQALIKTQKEMQFVVMQSKNLFRNCSKTPNLKEIFPTIEPHKLKRTSSAVWDRSGMSRLDTLSEED